MPRSGDRLLVPTTSGPKRAANPSETFRKELYEEYQSHRPEMESDLSKYEIACRFGRGKNASRMSISHNTTHLEEQIQQLLSSIQ